MVASYDIETLDEMFGYRLSKKDKNAFRTILFIYNAMILIIIFFILLIYLIF